jgi:hypothetical protein
MPCHKSLRVSGAVCEFGVAQGATSALIANELLHHAPDRTLWLYDSFEGLPAPTDKDELVDDLLGLGDVKSYAGQFAVPRLEVEHRLAAITWPRDQTRIMAGFFTRTSELPEQVAFAYVDFDFFEPILNALNAIHSRSQVGTIVIVDDYGRFSAGAQTATDEFTAAEWRRLEAAATPELSGLRHAGAHVLGFDQAISGRATRNKPFTSRCGARAKQGWEPPPAGGPGGQACRASCAPAAGAAGQGEGGR